MKTINVDKVLAKARVDAIHKFQVPIFGSHRKFFRLIGTGVLITLPPFDLFVTAGHVATETESLKYDNPHLCFPTFPKISAYLHDIKICPHDKIDLAVGPLNDGALSDLVGYQPLPITRFFKEQQITDDLDLVFYGYPGSYNKSKQKYKNPKQFVNKAFAFESFQRFDLYEKLKLSPNHYIICDYDKEKTIAAEENDNFVPPDPHGLSGGGVWGFERNTSSYRLVGIGLEYKKEYNAVIAIRCHWVIEFARSILAQDPNFFEMPERVFHMPGKQ